MDRMKIAAIFCRTLGGKEITVCGWARTIRDMKTSASLSSTTAPASAIQVVMSADELHNYKGDRFLRNGRGPGSSGAPWC